VEDFERNSSIHLIRIEYNFDLLMPSLNTFLFQLPERVFSIFILRHCPAFW
jgi:hypothetical protein